MKRLLVIVCIVCMVGAWGCATDRCTRRTFWSDFAQWFQLDSESQRKWATYRDDHYWSHLFNVDDESLGYWNTCP